MSVKEKLQIILITYNREKQLRRTFAQLYAENSPIKDYEILVLDNNSNDGTAGYIEELMVSHPNLGYQKNRYNLGISGNIAKAMEIAQKEYVWIICDDDAYDWSDWNKVEDAINKQEEFILMSSYSIPDGFKQSVPHQIVQSAFLPSCLFRTSLFTNETIRNAFDNIYTLFPHLYPLIKLINDGKKVYVIDNPIVNNAMCAEETGYEYTRGAVKEYISPRSRTMSWIVGFANALGMLNDKQLSQKTFMIGVVGIFGNVEDFYNCMQIWYSSAEDLMQIVDVYMAADGKTQRRLLKNYFCPPIGSVLKRPRILFNKLGWFKKKR